MFLQNNARPTKDRDWLIFFSRIAHSIAHDHLKVFLKGFYQPMWVLFTLKVFNRKPIFILKNKSIIKKPKKECKVIKKNVFVKLILGVTKNLHYQNFLISSSHCSETTNVKIM